MLEMIPMLNYFADLVYEGYAVNKKSQNHTSSCGKGWPDETHTILSIYGRHVPYSQFLEKSLGLVW
jgi:hypothetical protein